MDPETLPRKYGSRKKLGDANMITARTVSDEKASLDTIVARLNIERFCKIFSDEADEAKRHTLGRLIAEERAKLFTLVATPRVAVTCIQ
jgi:hypothetical protein